MDVIPAIDLRGGKCVRLYQGDYNQETTFSDDAVSVALNWQDQGAPRIHIVDLDGAAAGEPVNMGIIKDIANSVLIPTELGGGIRDLETIERVLKAGVERVILGTAAVENPELVKMACHKYGQLVVIGIDARDGFVATRGWLKEERIEAKEFAKFAVKMGARRIIYTDISRDGTLTEPNFSAISEMLDTVRIPVIAAGGISTITHLSILNKLGVAGAIVGKALYTGDISLKRALEVIGHI
ncbi:1-(5-phosphoribosyl)-5-[(5-phosphoribosylamino)methylideneamino]imidazole-4-carboxamide isomerase [Chloroflexota bacterium]